MLSTFRCARAFSTVTMRTTEKTGRESVCDVASRCDPRVLFADGERLGGGSGTLSRLLTVYIRLLKLTCVPSRGPATTLITALCVCDLDGLTPVTAVGPTAHARAPYVVASDLRGDHRRLSGAPSPTRNASPHMAESVLTPSLISSGPHAAEPRAVITRLAARAGLPVRPHRLPARPAQHHVAQS